jgi:hypothetical protein
MPDFSDFLSNLFGGPGAPLSLKPPGLDDADNGFLGKITSGINNNSNMLLGLAGGLAGGRSWADGLSKGLTAAASGSQADTAQQEKAGQRRALYKSLIDRGLSPQEALAASMSSDAMKMFAGRQIIKSGANDKLSLVGMDGSVRRLNGSGAAAPLPPRGPRGLHSRARPHNALAGRL